jgi:hypothetical protein
MTPGPQRLLDASPPGTGSRGRPRPRSKGGATATNGAPPSHVEMEGSNGGTVHAAPDTLRARRVDRGLA